MSEEIKETLDWTLEYLEGIDKTRGTKILTTNEANILLDYVNNLQQKVEQLKKENKELKHDCSCSFHDAEELNQNLTEIIDERNELDTKLIQLENIRKEAIKYVQEKADYPISYYHCLNDLLDILNKGDNKE